VHVSNSWPGGYQADVTVLNTGTTPTGSWAVRLALPSGVAVASIWNASVDSSAPATTVRNAGYNGTIPAGGSTSFGMTLSGSDQNLGLPVCTAT
jgi:cellulase/cellobiase CelA1